tara:strand:+ start:104 stop:1291 length:1188 start_codon:yes stop_codon:yes gene_type:complete
MNNEYDYIIIGSGIVGLSTAYNLLQKNKKLKVLILEKEDKIAYHQTGHNSGVIHAGVYYKPGSLKSKFCKMGVDATVKFCTKYQIPYEQCGKLIVATNKDELTKMFDLEERCKLNGLKTKILNKKELIEIEPNILGLGALKVYDSGITDYTAISKKISELIKEYNGKIIFKSEVISINEKNKFVEVKTSKQTFNTKKLIACAGLQSDRIAKMSGLKINFQIIPFRGDYYKINKRLNNIVKHLIYPIPDPRYSFLGVHLTRMIDGSITVGPNAALNISRENYDKFNFNFKDLIETLKFQGFWKFILPNFKAGIDETYSSISKRYYLKLCQKYCPKLELSDLEYHPSGIRAQAVSNKGELIHDFMIERTNRTIHVCNAPSPAATSAFPIGKYISELS